MKRSTSRILTTHTGSLPRPPELAQIEHARDQRVAKANPQFEQMVSAAVKAAVDKQVAAGVDVVNDGEASKVSYSTYITDRVTGFDGDPMPRLPQAEESMFPEFYAGRAPPATRFIAASCTGPITWKGDELVQRDIANLKGATQGVPAEEVFISSASPGVIAHFLSNAHYKDEEEYIFALAAAMKHEYRAIADSGFLLQLDCPDLAMSWNRGEYAGRSYEDFRKATAMHVEAINGAIQGIPPERIRLHLCWGNTETPHVRDIPFAQILDIVLTARVGALSFEGANPRHEHEWKLFKDVKLPGGMIIIPGVIDSTTNFVEHPELVAERISRYASVVGKENVIAGSDCGFGTSVISTTVHPSIAWVKLQAMAEGARLASKELWG